jgi:hypothetical protein
LRYGKKIRICPMPTGLYVVKKARRECAPNPHRTPGTGIPVALLTKRPLLGSAS